MRFPDGDQMTISQASIDALTGGSGNAPPVSPPPISTPPSSQTPQPAPQLNQPDIRRILNLDVPVTAILAERLMTIEGILGIAVGSIIEFEVSFDSDLMLRVANQPIGSGQAVKVGENFGVRVSHIGSVRDRIDAMGGTQHVRS